MAVRLNPRVFSFKTTAEINEVSGIIGQERARRALDFGLSIRQPGYNIYLAGPAGTGKTTLAGLRVKEQAKKRPSPSDWCYVNNFQNPDCPKAVRLPSGRGNEFARDMEHLVSALRREIPRAQEGEEFETEKNSILGRLVAETNRMYAEADRKARLFGFTLTRTNQGISSVPLRDGEPITQEQFDQLGEEEKTRIMEAGKKVQEIITEGLREYRELEKQIRQEIAELERETCRRVMAPLFADLFEKYRDSEAVIEYLDEVQSDMLDNLELFAEHDESANPMFLFKRFDRRTALRRYKVNVLVDNSSLKQAPVIVENNPTFVNLFGTVDYEGEFGVLSTDFTRIKAGSIHRANGGYLILQARDLFRYPLVWDALKRVLKTREAVVESLYKSYGLGGSEALKPEAIPVDLKVILIGDYEIYYILRQYDEDFQKLFKIRADFTTDMDKDEERLMEYARFVASVCRESGLLPFGRDAVAAVVDIGARIADDQRKLTTEFNRLTEIVYEAEAWARAEEAPVVKAVHVRRAYTEKIYRASLYEERLQRAIEEGTILIDVDGEKVGQINGLAVYSLGDYAFGRPSRITARTFVGERGVVNIEREIRLSGSIHSKGVLILSGYLGGQYARKFPLSLSASLTFEQNYSGIEGDSASSAELYALLSSLAEVPIKQGIAVTGSVNQNGEIQPVGGVNEKIEGFFRVCAARGLTGEQGVIIPRQNVKNFMLADEVVEAVKAGNFHIWAVSHVNEGIEILMGLPAGNRRAGGEFPENTLHHLVEKRLKEWAMRHERGGRRKSARPGSKARKETHSEG